MILFKFRCTRAVPGHPSALLRVHLFILRVGRRLKAEVPRTALCRLHSEPQCAPCAQLHAPHLANSGLYVSATHTRTGARRSSSLARACSALPPFSSHVLQKFAFG